MLDPDVANEIATWLGLAFGLAGLALGIINFIHTARISKDEKRTQLMLDGISLDRQAANLGDQLKQLDRDWESLANDEMVSDEIRSAVRASAPHSTEKIVARNTKIREGTSELLRGIEASDSLTHATLEEIRRFFVTSREEMAGMTEETERMRREMDRLSALARKVGVKTTIVEKKSGPRDAP